jgi:hypothetical protein
MFLNPLGLIALLGVPAVIALHLFRRRFQPRVVSALFLWESRTTTSLSGRRRDRLLRSPSFWSELLLALLLGLAIAGPRACGELEARHLVVVLDTSASMSAKRAAEGIDEEESAADAAVARVRELIDELPGGSRVTIVASGATPRILSGPAAFPEEASQHLDQYPRAATAGRHDLEPATSLALQLAGGGAVTLFTDRYEPERYPEEVGIEALGRPAENFAITRAARVGLSPGRDQVLITVVNFADRPREATVTLSAGAEPLDALSVDLAAGERKHLSFEVPAAAPTLLVRLAPDALRIDDETYLVAPPRRTLALATTLEPAQARLLGLSTEAAPLQRWLALVEDSVPAASLEQADVVITSESAEAPRPWALVLHATSSEHLDLVGPFLIERSHPLLAGISLDGVVWSAGSDTELPGLPLVSAGNRPLLTEEVLAERTLFHLNIDMARSSLRLSPDWPILLDNLAELRRKALPGPERTNLGMGETFRFRGGELKELSLQTPSAEEPIPARSDVEITSLREVGRYSLLSAGVPLAEFAVHFGDDAESDVRQQGSGARTSSVTLAEQRAGSSWLELLLTVLALGCLGLDWYVLRPKRLTTGGGRS